MAETVVVSDLDTSSDCVEVVDSSKDSLTPTLKTAARRREGVAAKAREREMDHEMQASVCAGGMELYGRQTWQPVP